MAAVQHWSLGLSGVPRVASRPWAPLCPRMPRPAQLGRSKAGEGLKCSAAAAAAGDGSDHRPVLEADSIIDPEGHVTQRSFTAEEQRELWKKAIKLPMYSVGIVPILVSAAAVYLQTNVLDLGRTLGFIFAAVCIIAWLNLSNDVFDSHTGVDDAHYKPESVVNLTGSRWRVFLLAHSLLAAGGWTIYRLLSTVADPLPGKMLAAAVAMGYLYQGPPFRFSYLGLGEPLCFMAFGPLATCAFYLAQAPAAAAATINPMIIGLSLLVGISTTIILFCSHFHQVEGDRAAGKRSPLVRLGGEKATQVLKFSVGLVHALTLGMSIFGVIPLGCWTSVMVSYGFANTMVKMAEKNWSDAELVKPLKMLATRWHIAFGLMLTLGLLLQKIM